MNPAASHCYRTRDIVARIVELSKFWNLVFEIGYLPEKIGFVFVFFYEKLFC